MKDIPPNWRKLLDDLQKKNPKIILAGGALRDLDHGVAVKDLDIFVEAGDEPEASGLNELLGGKKVDNPDAQLYPASMKELILVSELEPVLDILVQLIFCNWRVTDIWKRFDYGLCQIVFDGIEVRVSDEYDADKADKRFRLLRADNEYAMSRSIERYARWKPKYPEHGWCLGTHINFGVDRIQGIP